MDIIEYHVDSEPHEPTFLPEERLLIAVFDRAVRDLLFPEKGTPREAIRSAKRYFKGSSSAITSFRYLCDHFDLCQEEVRRLIFSEEGKERFLFLIKSSRRRG